MILLALGQANCIVAQIVHTIPLPQEGITKDCQGSNGLREIHAHEGADARALYLQDVVVRPDLEVITGEGECEIGETVALGAVNGVLAVEGLLRTNLFVPVIVTLKLAKKRYETITVHNRAEVTYRSSAMVDGRAIREVPVSRITPVLSMSARSLPNVMASRSTSQ